MRAGALVRDFNATGIEALAPRTDLASDAAFAYQELSLGRFRLQFGGRVDWDSYRVRSKPAAIRMVTSMTTSTARSTLRPRRPTPVTANSRVRRRRSEFR